MTTKRQSDSLWPLMLLFLWAYEKKERRKLNKTLFELKKVWNIGMPLKVKRQDRDYLVNVMQ